MAVSTRWLTRIALVALAAGLLALLLGAAKLWQARGFNQALANRDWALAATHDSPHGLLAGAYATVVSDPAEDFSSQVQAFGKVVAATAAADVLPTANYDLATLYLGRGLQLIATEKRDQALPLLTLAKDMFRGLLRDNPAHWDSKYNLELTLRAAPDLAEEEAVETQPSPGPSSRAVGARRSKQALP